MIDEFKPKNSLIISTLLSLSALAMYIAFVLSGTMKQNIPLILLLVSFPFLLHFFLARFIIK